MIVSNGTDPHFVDISGSLFSFATDGAKRRSILWPEGDHNTGWLALDTNGNGKIDSVSELFTSLTPQTTDRPLTPLNALQKYDLPTNGGNNDGRISIGDAVYSRLQVWLDMNKDGHSQESELFSLEAMGVKSIPLSPKVDAHGCFVGESLVGQEKNRVCITIMTSRN